MQPKAIEIMRARFAGPLDGFPSTRCLPAGIPVADLFATPLKIVQTPRLIVILYEDMGLPRQVFLDGRRLPEDRQPAWMGYSVGRWDGDTLVVESAGFNDQTWLDTFGYPHSTGMYVTERFLRRDFGHMETAITIDDPQMYTKPFTIRDQSRTKRRKFSRANAVRETITVGVDLGDRKCHICIVTGRARSSKRRRSQPRPPHFKDYLKKLPMPTVVAIEVGPHSR